MNELNEIIKQKEAAEASLFKLKGVTGVDVGYKYSNGKRTDEVTIRVHVKQKQKNVNSKERIPKEINGIKTDVLEMEVFPQVASMQLDQINLLADTNTYATVKGGVSIGPERVINGFVYTGTLGCIVKDNVTNNPVLLSNFHVMCVDNNWNIGDFMCQPSRVDTGVPGTDRIGALSRAVLSSKVDGAISTLSGRPSDCSIVDIGDVKGTANAVLNSAVRKRGRTTLFTEGFVDAINATINIDYGPTIGIKTLTNQIGIRPDVSANPKFSQIGDSGSVVVNADNKIIGLLFAGNDFGYTYINPISNVLSELNISICTKIIPKSIIKDFIDNKGNRKDFKDKREKLETKELRKDKLETKELRKDKTEIKEIIKDFKEFPDNNKHLPDKPDEGGKFREIFDPGKVNPGKLDPGRINPGFNDNLEQRITSLENLMNTMSAYISQDLRPDLSSGALNSEEDVYMTQEKMNKDITDSMG